MLQRCRYLSRQIQFGRSVLSVTVPCEFEKCGRQNCHSNRWLGKFFSNVAIFFFFWKYLDRVVNWERSCNIPVWEIEYRYIPNALWWVIEMWLNTAFWFRCDVVDSRISLQHPNATVEQQYPVTTSIPCTELQKTSLKMNGLCGNKMIVCCCCFFFQCEWPESY